MPAEVLLIVCVYIYEFSRHVQHAALAPLNVQHLSTQVVCLLSHYYASFQTFCCPKDENYFKTWQKRKTI